MMRIVLLLVSLVVVTANYAAIPQASAETVLTALFKVFKVTDVDPATCVTDSTGAETDFRQFAEEWKDKRYEDAIASLSSGFNALSSTLGDCGVDQLQHLIDAGSLAVKFAKIGKKLDDIDSLLVGASDLVEDVHFIAEAVSDGDDAEIGNAIGKFLIDWTQVIGGCGDDHKGCAFVGGVLRIIQEVATDIKPCEDAIRPALASLEAGSTAFKNKDHSEGIKLIAEGLDELAKALSNHACGVPKIADLVGKMSPKLANAVVKVENSEIVMIIVGAADIYDELYSFVAAMENKDYGTAGEEMAQLLRALRASNCQTKACIVLEGLMASMQLELESFDNCMKDADSAWHYMQNGHDELRSKHYKDGVHDYGRAIVTLASAVTDCQIPGIAKVAEDMFTKLQHSTIANNIGNVVQLLVEGADVTSKVDRAALDFGSKNWAAFGNDLGSIAEFLASTKCNSVACQIVEGLLNAAGIAFQNLEVCEKDLYSAIDGFTQGAQLFDQKSYKSAIKTWATSLNQVAVAVKDCGLEKELGFIEQESNVMGFANVTANHEGLNILIHGADFYHELFATLQDIKHHDYHAAGNDLHDVMNNMNKWTHKHSCDSDWCYIVIGMFEFIGDMQGSVKECANDFKLAHEDFHYFASNISDSHHSIIFHWKHDKKAIKAGIKALGDGMHDVARGVQDCHLKEFADLLAKLATKLGVVPEITLIEELLHILINGVKIEKEIGDACDAFARKNWPGVGYNVARLTKTLL
jgi:hypothetical protein